MAATVVLITFSMLTESTGIRFKGFLMQCRHGSPHRARWRAPDHPRRSYD